METSPGLVTDQEECRFHMTPKKSVYNQTKSIYKIKIEKRRNEHVTIYKFFTGR